MVAIKLNPIQKVHFDYISIVMHVHFHIGVLSLGG